MELNFNIDGLPLHNSTKKSFWPILCKVNFDNCYPFAVAIYRGKIKPPLDQFLEKFVNELKEYLRDGILFDSKKIKISVRLFYCDMPARAFIKNKKGHNAYKGCDKCHVKGEYVERKMTFPNFNAELRTNENFAMQSDTEYHKGLTPLLELNFGLVTGFPVDYMHSRYLLARYAKIIVYKNFFFPGL